MTAWGSLGSGYGQLNGPTGIAVDGSGNVYVTENGFRVTLNPFSRIQEFDEDGRFLSAWGSFGSANGQFRYPSGVAVDGSGNVFVLDQGNARIEKFGYATFGLTVSRDGSGLRHRRTTAGSDIDCGTTCSAPFTNGSMVTLTETPGPNSVFNGWNSDCTVVGGDCHVTMDQARTVIATFVSVHSITLTTAGAGSGSVDPDTSGRSDCGSTSILCYETGRSVILTATPSPGSRFIGWSGDCSGVDDCTVSTDTDTAVTATFELKIDQTIMFASISRKTMAQSGLAINPIASSGLAVIVTSATPMVCDISQGTVMFSAPGTCTLHADQAGDANYNPAPTVTRTFTITKANQKITFASISKKTRLQSGFAISPTASSGLAVSVISATTPICDVSQGTVVFYDAGTCTLQANQAGDANYNPAKTVTRSFSITKATQKITFASISTKRMSQSGFAISPTASSGLIVTVTSTTPSVCVAQGMTIIFNTPGTCSLIAEQAGDLTYAPAPTLTRSFTIKP